MLFLAYLSSYVCLIIKLITRRGSGMYYI